MFPETMNLDPRFERKLDEALKQVRTILDKTKIPTFPHQIHHKYEDKYALSEHLTNCTLQSLHAPMSEFGFELPQLILFASKFPQQSATLRFKSEEHCTFLREVTKQVESPISYQSGVSFLDSVFQSVTEKTLTTITEYHYKFETRETMFCFFGPDPQNQVLLRESSKSFEFFTISKDLPYPSNSVNPSLDLNITWLIKQANNSFQIDRNNEKCHTPSRNPEIDEAQSFLRRLGDWAIEVELLKTKWFGYQASRKQERSVITRSDSSRTFIPILPIFSKIAKEDNLYHVPTEDLDILLAAQKSAITERNSRLQQTYTTSKGLITSDEVILVVTLFQISEIVERYNSCIQYIEETLRNSLISAIGKEVQPSDLDEYMIFHNRKLFSESYVPLPFSYPVRAGDSCPEGTLSILAEVKPLAQPIFTHSRKISRGHKCAFAINASTKVSFFGSHYIHGFVQTKFSNQVNVPLNLNAQANQFSAFILVVGRILSSREIDPTYAILVENKDDLKIPLSLETIPTPKQFKDAIESLSDEQKRFAQAYRGLQLSSTLFGVVVLPLRPQLERVLNLPSMSLAKEIKLVQELLLLFKEYHISSDLLGFLGDEDLGVKEKVEFVRGQVKKMMGVIRDAKEEILRKKEEEKRRRAEEERKRREEEMRRREAEELRKKEEERRMREEEERKRREEEMRRREAEEPRRKAEEMRIKEEVDAVKEVMMMNIDVCLERGEKLDLLVNETFVFKSKAHQLSRRSVFGSLMKGVSSVASSVSDSVSSALESIPQADAPQREIAIDVPAGAPSSPEPPVEAPRDEASKDEAPKEEAPKDSKSIAPLEESIEDVIDYTKIPKMMDAKFSVFDTDDALRPTIINPEKHWHRTRSASLISSSIGATIDEEAIKTERNHAFDLFDSLSRSGSLPFLHSDFHIVIASTHCFDQTIIETIIQKNSNPIEKVERSTVIVSACVHDQNPKDLINPQQLPRFSAFSPLLVNPDSWQ